MKLTGVNEMHFVHEIATVALCDGCRFISLLYLFNFVIIHINNQIYYSRGADMVHEMKLRSGPFFAIKNGKKDIELRLLDEKRRGISVGDEIVFISMDSPENKVRTLVKKLHIFENFAELYANFDNTRLGYSKDEKPDPKDMEKYYTPEEQKLYGVVGIEIKLS